MQQDQNIKGFTILELLVVITIVAIISAVAYPNFSNWRQDRELRAAMEKAATMLSSVNTLSQRGNYPFVQFRVTPNGTTSTKFISKKSLDVAYSPVVSTVSYTPETLKSILLRIFGTL